MNINFLDLKISLTKNHSIAITFISKKNYSTLCREPSWSTSGIKHLMTFVHKFRQFILSDVCLPFQGYILSNISVDILRNDAQIKVESCFLVSIFF